MLCLPTAYVGDQLEHWNVLNLLQNGGFPDCNDLVKEENLSDPDSEHPKRTIAATQQVGLDDAILCHWTLPHF